MIATRNNGNALATKLAAIQAYDMRGWCLTPCRARGKEPYRTGWQSERLDLEQITDIVADNPSANIGMVLGKSSDNIVCIDLDNPVAVELADEFLPPTPLVVGRGKNPRTHWFYCVPAGIKAAKLKLPADPNDREKKLTVVEILSDGNQVIVGPSVHPDDDLYDVLNGEPATVDADELLEAAQSLFHAVLDRLGLIEKVDPKKSTNSQPKASTADSGLSPGKDFDERGDVRELLQRHGWTRIGAAGNDERWRRPGKDHGISGTLKDGRLFYCFTSSAAGLEGGKAYGPFGLFAALECGGDFHQAHERLKVLGFGNSLSAQPHESSGKPGLCRRRQDMFQSFPTEILPSPIRRYVVAQSMAIDCDESFVALPVLAVLAASIGNTRRIRLKRSWTEPSILWTALVANSGTRKSPPIEAGTKPIRDRQVKALKRYAEQVKEYERAVAEHAITSKKYKGDGEPPRKPEEPIAERHLASDLTIEALAYLLRHQPRGLLVCRDELDGWLGAFDQYRAGNGSDQASWLEMHGGRSLTIDRKTGTSRTLFIPRASVSLCGGIQPGVLAHKITGQHITSGLVARMLFAFPPARPRRWTDADVDDRVTEQYDRVVENLLGIPFATDENSEPEPALVGLSADAQHRFARFVNEHGAIQSDLDDALSASFAKLEGYAARFALILHLSRWASGEAVEPSCCDLQSIEAGIVLSGWFANEAKRVHGLLGESDDETKLRQLAEWITRRGGRATARDIYTGNRGYPTADEADSALNRLVNSKMGEWHDIPPGEEGGRPSRVFCLRLHNPQNAEKTEVVQTTDTENVRQLHLPEVYSETALDSFAAAFPVPRATA